MRILQQSHLPSNHQKICTCRTECVQAGLILSQMLQTGDPLGDGTGGESIWGGNFEDEFSPKARHDRPYTLSMANAGMSSSPKTVVTEYQDLARTDLSSLSPQ